ncbi:MAG: glucose-6-phosphate dehydrogenase [Hellea sp.]|nr:glucose-6-phosphate dehydrogenase [Hellea sp.]
MAKKSKSTDKAQLTPESHSAFLPVDSFDLVVFGGTGDLARRKLIPALYHRFCDGQIPKNSRIIGTSRSDRSDKAYKDEVHKAYHQFSSGEDYDDKCWDDFASLLNYVALDVSDEKADWDGLAKALSQGGDRVRVFYLAVPPKLFVDICKGLKTAGLVTPNARVVLEKPLGTDYASAKAINEGVRFVFDENKIYRIDHYLGKETVQNLLVLRFGNILLEPLWSNRAIDHIEITVAESIGVGGRGSYYDGAGALRDMVQNHLLQLLCLTAMEAPASLDADDVRTEKLKVLRALRPITKDNAPDDTVRGQYARGKVDDEVVADYLTDVGVDDSNTETFVAIKAHIDNWRWAGVPIYIRTGKRMAERRSDIVIQFKDVPHSVFGNAKLNANRMVIRLQPDEAVRLWMEIKEPGAGGMRLKSLPLNLTYADNFTVRYPDAYERLLMDVVRGNLSLFMRGDEVEAAWKWVDQILGAWQDTEQRLELYQAGQDGPDKAHDMLARDDNQWV